ncbi:long-chain fatty acid--CoA ligase [Acidobacteria bacterium AH-259-A15]|nr:long-chain fatty acid--CoA ligase [Acidobacteria bacterium AH-259-A15]
MSLNLGNLLANSARYYGDQTALIFHSQRYSYQQLDSMARQFAWELMQVGIGPGDKVAIMLPNGPPFTIAYFGTLYAGAVAVTLSMLQAAEEVAYQLNDCDAKAFVLHADCRTAGMDAFRRTDQCRKLYWVADHSSDNVPEDTIPFDNVLGRSSHSDVWQTRADETAVIIYTSGTTGHPKGAELTHFNLFYNAQYICERAFSIWPKKFNILGPGHVALAALPLYHIFGQTNVQNALLFGGGAISYIKRFSAKEAVNTIVRDGVTFFPGVPTMYFAILHDPESQEADLSNLKFCVSGGAPMPVEVKRRFENQFGVRIQEGYGLTETSPLATLQRPDETAKCGTIGKPISGVEILIFDDQDCEVPRGEKGEIVIRGHNVMKGYYKCPEATAEALRGGWFHTGDIGYIDPDGDIFIVDRKKEMILRGGRNVYPREVEEVLYTHPAVREAAVIGVPDEKYGEEVKAVVSLKAEYQATAKEIIHHCKQHLAAYKYPRTVDILEELPKGPTGKILKRALRE